MPFAFSSIRAVATLALLAGCGTAAERPSPMTAAISPPQAEALYRDRCAKCHEGGVERAPNAAALRNLSPARIKASLTDGIMALQGQGLTNAQRDALAHHLGRPSASPHVSAGLASARCGSDAAAPLPADALARPHWNGWGAGTEQHRSQTGAMAQLAAADVPRLKLKWAFGFADATRMAAQPTVVGGVVFIGSAGGAVVALDSGTGCLHWHFTADAGVRSAITLGRSEGAGWSAYFGDLRGNVYAVDAATGALRWRTRLDEHRAARVTGAPVLNEGVLVVPMSSIEEALSVDPKYPCCTFQGSVSAVDAATGRVRWKRHLIDQAPAAAPGRSGAGPSGAAVWSAPTVDAAKRRLYVTTSNSYSDPPAPTANAIVALDLDRGDIAWVHQATAGDAYTMACNTAPAGSANCPAAGGPDLDFGASPMLIKLGDGRRALIVGQKSGVVHAVDPDRDGALLWRTRLGQGGRLGGVQWGTATDGRLVFAALSDVRIEAVAAGTPGAQPAFGAHLRFDPSAGGGLFALEAQTGRIVWRTPHPGCGGKAGCSPAQSAALTLIPGVVFSGGLDGHLRAYDAADGHIVWDVDTAIAHPNTVNGVAAQGGSLDGPGPVIAGGLLLVGSGYAVFGGMPGNVLLAYTVDGR